MVPGPVVVRVGETLTTIHVTPAASAITQTMKSKMPMTPRTLVTLRRRIAPCPERA